jgi:hypothetical protein
MNMSILKYFSVILVGLAATVSQAEIAITVPTAEEPLERASAPSDATPREIELKVAPLRLAIDLVDGSHIIGVPSITSVPFQTSYAKMDIPWEKIVSIEIQDDHETASFQLQNGDRLKGVLDLNPLELETIFGEITVGMQHILRVEIRSLRASLVLHYSFDEDEGDTVTDMSLRGNDGKAFGITWMDQGKVGRAASFDGIDDYIAVVPKSDVSAIEDVTVSVWTYLQDWKSQPGGKTDRQYIFDGHSHSSSIRNAFYRDGCSVFYDGTTTTEEIWSGVYYYKSKGGMSGSFGAPIKGQWHHVVYMRRGNTGYTYLDGELVKPSKELGHKTSEPLDMQHTWFIGTFSGNNPSYGSRINYSFHGLMDEVMVWTRALSEGEIKQVYNLQK